MIDKNKWTKIDWSQYNTETKTYIGSTQYAEFELDSKNEPILKSNFKNIAVNGAIQPTNL